MPEQPELVFADWVAVQLRQRRWLYVAGAVACGLLSAGALWLTWWALWLVFAFIGLGGGVIVPAVWGTLALLCVAYATANRERLERLEFESATHLQATRIAARLTGSPFLALAGPKTAGSFVKVISLTLLIGPGLAATAWDLWKRSRTAALASPEHVAGILLQLAASDRRIPLEELLADAGPDRPATTLAAAMQFDGVVLRSTDPIGLLLTDDFRGEIVARAGAEKKSKRRRQPLDS